MSKRMSNDLAQTMHEANISPDRLIHVPWVPSLWQAVQECEVDVYLNSFPLGGGRAIVELLGSGTPVIMHQNYRSRIFGTVDMAYPEAFSWRTPEELLEHLKSLTPDQVREEALLARRHYEETHTFADFRTRVLAGHQAPPAPPLREYTHDALQTFLEDIGAAG